MSQQRKVLTGKAGEEPGPWDHGEEGEKQNPYQVFLSPLHMCCGMHTHLLTGPCMLIHTHFIYVLTYVININSIVVNAETQSWPKHQG